MELDGERPRCATIGTTDDLTLPRTTSMSGCLEIICTKRHPMKETSYCKYFPPMLFHKFT